VDDYDKAYSLALSDHYFALDTLREIGGAIPKQGRPSLPPEQEEQMLATIRDPNLQRILGLGGTAAPATKKATATKKGTIFMRWFGRQSRARTIPDTFSPDRHFFFVTLSPPMRTARSWA
jgi:hypothetical protein